MAAFPSPSLRLTNLGIRQVDEAAVEAAASFGSTPWQLLGKVQLPLALPAIMLGVNQTVMMVLSMVIIAGLIGGAGLGFEVVAGLANNKLGRGLEAGLAIVIMAIILLVLGPRRLPELGNTMGKAIKNFNDAMSGVEDARFKKIADKTDAVDSTPVTPATEKSSKA